MNKPVSTPSRTKALAAKYGLAPRKTLGQNFLIDTAIAVKCAEALKNEGSVIEIGSGMGALTEQLAPRFKHVCAYEKDPKAVNVLSETMSSFANVEIIARDFRKADVKELCESLKARWGSVSVCANLPYNITSFVLFALLGKDIDEMALMVQKEVGERLWAGPKESAYGALTVQVGFFYEVRKLFIVKPESFWPSPKVDSAVVGFAKKEKINPDIDSEEFFKLVRASFAQPRKTLFNNLRAYLGSDEKARAALAGCGLKLTIRPQECAPGDFESLYEVTR